MNRRKRIAGFLLIATAAVVWAFSPVPITTYRLSAGGVLSINHTQVSQEQFTNYIARMVMCAPNDVLTFVCDKDVSAEDLLHALDSMHLVGVKEVQISSVDRNGHGRRNRISMSKPERDSKWRTRWRSIIVPQPTEEPKIGLPVEFVGRLTRIEPSRTIAMPPWQVTFESAEVAREGTNSSAITITIRNPGDLEWRSNALYRVRALRDSFGYMIESTSRTDNPDNKGSQPTLAPGSVED